MASALFYYYINSFLWLNKNQTSNEKIKKDKQDIKKKKFKLNIKLDMYKLIIILVLVLCGTSIAITTIIYKQKEKQIKYQKKQETLRQENLQKCINKAKESRSNLWNTNCKRKNNGSCTISNKNTIQWIESRYKTDLDNCYKIYK